MKKQKIFGIILLINLTISKITFWASDINNANEYQISFEEYSNLYSRMLALEKQFEQFKEISFVLLTIIVSLLIGVPVYINWRNRKFKKKLKITTRLNYVYYKIIQTEHIKLGSYIDDYSKAMILTEESENLISLVLKNKKLIEINMLVTVYSMVYDYSYAIKYSSRPSECDPVSINPILINKLKRQIEKNYEVMNIEERIAYNNLNMKFALLCYKDNFTELKNAYFNIDDKIQRSRFYFSCLKNFTTLEICKKHKEFLEALLIDIVINGNKDKINENLKGIDQKVVLHIIKEADIINNSLKQ